MSFILSTPSARPEVTDHGLRRAALRSAPRRFNGRLPVLVLTRKMGEGIVLGENVHVKVLRISGSRVTIGIEAPPSVRVLRADLQQEPSRGAGHDETPAQAELDGAALVR